MGQGARCGAQTIFAAGVRAADARLALAGALQERPLEPAPGRLLCLAIGKAAVGMAEVALGRLRPDRIVVVTTYENEAPVAGAEVFAAGHPVPDENGLEAARAVEELVRSAGADDHVLVLISGGASALLPAPVAGLTLDDKRQVNACLLSGGLDIGQMNLVRQRLSRLKGGGLARLAAPARVTALVLSDVIGDDLRAVASGPCAPPLGTNAGARELLVAHGLWDKLPEAARAVLSRPDAPGTLRAPEAELRLIGSNALSLQAMATAAPGAMVFPEPLVGDVAAAARRIVERTGPGTWLFGGETTVRLTGDGLGGRNQELALRVALEAERAGWRAGWVFLSGGTDGRDGPTDAAGALVDHATLERIRDAGIDPQEALGRNDSYHALKAAGDLLITGATGTNVADLQVLMRP